MWTDQRYVALQLVLNKRRKKRKGKPLLAAKKDILTRVVHVLLTGNINDYTHPKEVDPYWGILYKQYEYLCYMELQLKATLRRSSHVFSDEAIIRLYHTFQYVEELKQQLITYMMGFMNLLFRSVMSRRFYGWIHYSDEFLSKFTETALSSINQLRFDIDQTRCSVYFYQAFWLAGISLTEQIRQEIARHTDLEVLDYTTNYIHETDEQVPDEWEPDYCKSQNDFYEPTTSYTTEDTLIKQETYGAYKELHKLLPEILSTMSISTLETLNESQLQELASSIKQKILSGEIKVPELVLHNLC